MWILFATLAQANPCTLTLMTPSPQLQGQPQPTFVLGAVPGSEVLLFRDGDDTACPPQLAPTCLDLDGASYVGSATADGGGVASFAVTVPAGLEPTEHQWQAISQECGLSNMSQTTAASPISCAYDPLDWTVECASGPMGCFLTGWFDTMYPSGMPAFGTTLSLEQVRSALASADPHIRAAIALSLSVDADDMGLFGTRAAIGDQFVPNGPHVGSQVREVASLALVSTPVSSDLGSTAVQVLQTFGACGDDQLVMPGWPTFPPDTGPGDTGDSGAGGDTGTPADSAVDTGVLDTGSPDSGSDSASVVDTGAAGTDSASVVDTGAAGTDSASVVDTGAGDTGSYDSGSDSASVVDTGVGDTGSYDSGAPGDSGSTEDTGASDSGSGFDDSSPVDSGIGGADTADSGG